MFGMVLEMLNTSACRPAPSAAASSADRTKPLSRETMVPDAITALEERIRLWSEFTSLLTPGVTRPSFR